jgi:uncharacterized protein
VAQRYDKNGQTMSDQPQRIRVIDIVRGVAVLGIFTINAADMAYPQDLVLDFRAGGITDSRDSFVAVAFEVLFAGKMRGLFTLLFGVSSILIIDRLVTSQGPSAAAVLYRRRLGWLAVFGLFNAYVLLWWGDVLLKYALLGILLLPLGRVPSRLLVIAILGCLAVLTFKPYQDYREAADLERNYLHLQREGDGHPTGETAQQAVDDWQHLLTEMIADEAWTKAETAVKTGVYPGIFVFNIPIALEEQTSIFLAEDLWDMLPYMLLGILLVRAGFFGDQFSVKRHLLIAFAGIGLGLAIHLWLNVGLYRYYTDPVRSLFYPVFFDLGRLPFVAGYASLIILLSRMELTRHAGNWLAAVGRMALSNYLLQSIIGALVFYGFGLSLFNQFSRVELAGFILVVWCFQIVCSVAWMRWFHFGPAEWAWRSLTYWQAQPLRR